MVRERKMTKKEIEWFEDMERIRENSEKAIKRFILHHRQRLKKGGTKG